MATTTLERVKIKARPKVSEEVRQIARDAMMLLGYTDLADDVLTGEEKLSEVLRRLEIKPYSWQSVKAYQEKKQREANKKPGYFRWQEETLSNSLSVPLHVLRKAIEIKRACPKVKFFVCSLQENPDPFLIARLGHESYYVEVWDEKDFELSI